MLKTKFIEKLVTQYNLRIFKKFGYKIGDLAIVDIRDWDIKSHEKVYANCDICGNIRYLPYREYINSFKKYEIYCCSSKCSQFKNKLTKKELYGDENYSNAKKYSETCLEKYGVDNTFKNKDIIKKIDRVKRKKYGSNMEEIVDKMKLVMIERYGVDNISKLDSIKDKKKETYFENFGTYYPMQSEVVKEKSRKKCLENYGVEYPAQSELIKDKIKKTCLERYGAEWFVLSNDHKKIIKEKYGKDINFPIDLLNMWKDTEDYEKRKHDIYMKIRNTNINNGNWFSDKSNDFKYYKKLVISETNKNIKILMEKWDGFDYYDNENISEYLSLDYNDKKYPTIDHKISVKYGFLNSILPKIIGSIDNLCLTKRSVNSKKNSKNENEFIIEYLLS